MIVALSGGIGNQLFQYAFGRGYEQRTGEKVLYDTSMLTRDSNRNFELDQYKIELSIAKGIRPFVSYFCYRLAPRNEKNGVISRLLNIQRETKVFTYQEDFVKNAYLVGYWQNEKYFLNIADDLKKDFVYKKPLNTEQKELIYKIENENAVAIHVRRGDYLSPQFGDIYYCLDKNYYKKAIEFVRRKVDSPKFYLFSDDIEWCKSEYSDMNDITYIDSKVSQNQHVDLHIMRQCKHFIIANSTFSWWGAWLSQYKEKIIVAPDNWFRNEKLNCAVKEAILLSATLM